MSKAYDKAAKDIAKDITGAKARLTRPRYSTLEPLEAYAKKLTNLSFGNTVFPSLDIAAGACSGNGIIFDISDPMDPIRIDEVVDTGFAYWHSATFNNDGTKVLFTDEWGGGSRPRCRTYDPLNCDNDGICEIGEDCVSCPLDCGQVSGATCGNGLCEAGDGENCLTCPADCAGNQSGTGEQWCCGDSTNNRKPHPEPLLHVGECYLALGDMANAEHAFGLAIEAAGNDVGHAKIKSRAETLQKAVQERKSAAE